MNQMVQEGINQFPGSNATIEQYLVTMPSKNLRQNQHVYSTFFFGSNEHWNCYYVRIDSVESLNV